MTLKIDRIVTRIVTVPYKESVKHPFLGARTHNAVLVVEVKTSDGCTGLSYIAILSHRLVAAVEQIVLDLEQHIKGLDPTRREHIYDLMWSRTVDLLHDGASNIAIAVIDIALWDIAAKQAGMPLWRFMGGYRDKVRVYASDALWRHQGPERLAEEAADLVGQGFDAMKLRFGARPIHEDIERAQALRKAVGPDVHIMTDLIWGFRAADAIRLAEGVKEVDLYWLEEPTREGDYEGMRRVRENTRIPIAGGERISRLSHLQLLIPCIDHAILDVHHIGGMTPWLRAAAILGEHDLPISSHSSHEFNVHLLAAVRTGAWIEHLPRREVLFHGFPKPEKGVIQLSERPGLGFELNEDAMKHYAANR